LPELVTPLFDVEESHYYSILPTATPFARNAIFSGMFPMEIAARHPDWWGQASDEESLNAHEAELLTEQLRELVGAPVPVRYEKLFSSVDGGELLRRLPAHLSQDGVTALVLPAMGLGVRLLLAAGDRFFVYPTKLREYQARYRGSFLHGGVTPEEVILPVALLTPRSRARGSGGPRQMGRSARVLGLLRPYTLLFAVNIVATVLSSLMDGATFVLLMPVLRALFKLQALPPTGSSAVEEVLGRMAGPLLTVGALVVALRKV